MVSCHCLSLNTSSTPAVYSAHRAGFKETLYETGVLPLRVPWCLWDIPSIQSGPGIVVHTYNPRGSGS